MRKPKKHAPAAVSPNAKVFSIKSRKPEALQREYTTKDQIEYREKLIRYGEDNALPLRIAKAVEESPAASACIDTITKFIKGSGFSDKDLMSIQIDKNGTTLWDFHCGLSESLALFWGFGVNFKFDKSGKILNSYQMSFESIRFKEPAAKSKEITEVGYNPYYGTSQYKEEFSETYPLYKNPNEVLNQIGALKNAEELKKWPGQVYYYGKTSPLSRFYPKPRYWSAKEAIEADHKLQDFHNQELENGFFQSVLMNAIGNPDAMSQNPRTQEEFTDESGNKRRRPTKTVGEEFNDQMANTFAGASKAGTMMVLWSSDANSAVKLQPFPSGINGDRVISTQDSITKTITIAMLVPSILANISEGVSLGSGGSEIQKAIELMQSRTLEWRQVLENFYNNVLLPNLQKPIKKKVEIQNYNPITEPVEVDDKIWEFLNEEEKIEFIKKNMPEIEIIRTATPAVAPAVDPATGEPVPADPSAPPAPAPAKPNDALKNLSIDQLNRIQKIVARYNLSLNDPNNTKALTYDQAKQMLVAFGFTEEELNAWLVKPEEL